ncbi:MAG: TatD family hydrolase, partial [Candidatus Thermoplasmatota archaeon]|nr:TatD family hydrolase [Candidatus Thermoplasmatota archaeon]
KTGVGILVSLGPYPVELLRMEGVLGKEKAVLKMKEGMEEAVRLISAGEAHALGEIGRPHFPVEQWVWDASNEILEYGMALASEAGCPVVVHCEGATDQTWKDLAQMADRTGLPRERVVKHYSSPVISEKDNLGIFPSVLASKDAVKNAFSQGNRFMMETDYIDDPARPGAVLAPTTVPKRTKWVLEEGLASDTDMDIVHRKNPEKMYGLEMV